MTNKIITSLGVDVEFKPWPKIPRGNNINVVVTEKLDGTNACIVVSNKDIVAVQSRKRFIYPEDDNFGFASWVYSNYEELSEGLGDGYHYGEWVGPGIQQNPMRLEEKQFFLFNTFRWHENNKPPACCNVVPTLYKGEYKENLIDQCMDMLLESRDYNPEGVILYSLATKTMTKYTFKNQNGKWQKDNG